jgi:hypothetical protein
MGHSTATPGNRWEACGIHPAIEDFSPFILLK